MSEFFIELANENTFLEDELFAIGKIRIGSFSETFHVPLSYWTRDKYRSQWKAAIYKLIHGENKVALITSMYSPKNANFILWWKMYRIEENIHIQNQVLFMEDLDKEFDEENIYQFIPERRTLTEDGDSISEWIISLKDIIDSIGNN